MKKIFSALFLLAGAITILSTAAPGCKAKPKDANIKTSIEAALKSDPQTSGLSVDVKEGVATVTGEVKDASVQATVATIVGGIKGVKSVLNNVTVTPPVVITPDDPLTMAVKDATKDFTGITATVKDGIIYVTGELKSADWKKLKMALDGLKPKKVDAAGLKISK
ncbi:MAG: BON domain-containing protein [Chitinophagaceae bacterium]|nr:BON domain-containing protein [Chitinophagaceae bacterium]MBP9098267.1 BON domain-containing protein [Ferruginibacter sp.]HQV61582.1 BON domain-containing protein [Chitinophagaceae bacterium]HQX74625.1 BON domain-containing protein [Chitinophagaceae bacterium]HQZ76228.1 BON domain-containing protein [Chitinophagaceae bacterium]